MSTETTEKADILTTCAKHISGADWKWRFALPELDLTEAEDMKLVLVNMKDGKRCVCPLSFNAYSKEEGSETEADLSPVRDTVDNSRQRNWRTYISFRRKADRQKAEHTFLLMDMETTASYIKGRENSGSKDRFECRLEHLEAPAGEMEYGDATVEIYPALTNKGEWRLRIGDRCLRYMIYVRCIAEESALRGGKFYFKVECPILEGFEWKGMALTYRYRLEEERKVHFFPADRIKRREDCLIVETRIDPDGLGLRPVYWDVKMVFARDGEQFWCTVKTSGESRKKVRDEGLAASMRKLFCAQSIKTADGYQISIGDTANENTDIIVQKATPYSGLAFRLKERLAILIYRLMRRNLKKKKILLAYEKHGVSAQENGFYFFKYCMDHDMETVMGRKIYYIIDKSQPDYAALQPYSDHVIQFMSLKHMVYILAAKLLVSSDSKWHSYAWRATESIIRPVILDTKRLVFLQHGVIGLKKVPMFKKGRPEGANLFIASSEREKGFIMDGLKYSSNEVVVTGLARWDVIEDRSGDIGQNRILILPTWRNWLNEPSDEVFLASEYYRRYMELINSDRLAAYLERYDLYVDFFIHPRLSEHLGKFTTADERIRLIPFGTQPINDLLMTCRMLVTDYSSVSWDVYYQGKPVIFYQFDLREYSEAPGSYMDLETELFGDRTEDLDALFGLFEEAAASDFELKPKYAKMRGDLFKYIDRDNSKRVCEEIMKRAW